MKIFAIGDLHLSGTPPQKPMDVFGEHWHNHWEKIRTHWQQSVTDDDIIFIVGDTSWAMRLDAALEDLQSIMTLPGQKYIIRGNHDYWWTGVSKMTKVTDGGLTFLQGHGLAVPASLTPQSAVLLAFGGTRGYLCPNDGGFTPDTDDSIYARELLRTEAALKEMDAAITKLSATTDAPPLRILLLHYPPFNDKNEASGFTELMERYHVDHCIFGHLHDSLSFSRIPESTGHTRLHLVSADYMNFSLKQIL
ncbi:metallophosphoesterase [uncultured Veillonella sp.]|uniref:metallophosphoesterase n=1 Tax=uncultured Veillonella sp. TaxID=159268 RepID=UPI00258677BF|nr:metallophosphoesterase [uncultured Veillonella sp.]